MVEVLEGVDCVDLGEGIESDEINEKTYIIEKGDIK